MIGTRDDEEKPVFAGLRPGQSLETIELEEALELFKLPRDLGVTEEGDEVAAGIGRFGPYIRYGNKFVSLKDIDPHDVTLEQALEADRGEETGRSGQNPGRSSKVPTSRSSRVAGVRLSPTVTKTSGFRRTANRTAIPAKSARNCWPRRRRRKSAVEKRPPRKRPRAKRRPAKRRPARKRRAKRPPARRRAQQRLKADGRLRGLMAERCR